MEDPLHPILVPAGKRFLSPSEQEGREGEHSLQEVGVVKTSLAKKNNNGSWKTDVRNIFLYGNDPPSPSLHTLVKPNSLTSKVSEKQERRSKIPWPFRPVGSAPTAKQFLSL